MSRNGLTVLLLCGWMFAYGQVTFRPHSSIRAKVNFMLFIAVNIFTLGHFYGSLVLTIKHHIRKYGTKTIIKPTRNGPFACCLQLNDAPWKKVKQNKRRRTCYTRKIWWNRCGWCFLYDDLFFVLLFIFHRKITKWK